MPDHLQQRQFLQIDDFTRSKVIKLRM
ncbi:hypothetical protein TNIN_403371, partial [Trichonephila inaurata madagascariensis]